MPPSSTKNGTPPSTGNNGTGNNNRTNSESTTPLSSSSSSLNRLRGLRESYLQQQHLFTSCGISGWYDGKKEEKEMIIEEDVSVTTTGAAAAAAAADWLPPLLVSGDKEKLMDMFQLYFQDCEDADDELYEDFTNAILRCRMRRAKRKGLSFMQDSTTTTSTATTPAAANAKKNRSKSKPNIRIRTSMSSDAANTCTDKDTDTITSPLESCSHRPSSTRSMRRPSSNASLLSSPAANQRMQFIHEAKKRREQVTTAAVESSTLLAEKYQQMSLQSNDNHHNDNDNDNPGDHLNSNTNSPEMDEEDEQESIATADDTDVQTEEATSHFQRIHISKPQQPQQQQHQHQTRTSYSPQHQPESARKESQDESFVTCDDEAVNNLMKEFDLSDQTDTETDTERDTPKDIPTNTNTNTNSRCIITDPNDPDYVPMPPSPEESIFTPRFTSSTDKHFPSDEKQTKSPSTPSHQSNQHSTSNDPHSTNHHHDAADDDDDDHPDDSSVQSDNSQLFPRKIHVTHDNDKENDGSIPAMPQEEATEITMPDIANLKFDIGKGNRSSAKLKKASQNSRRTTKHTNNNNNQQTTQTLFPPQQRPYLSPKAQSSNLDNHNSVPSPSPSPVKQPPPPPQFRVELKHTTSTKQNHGRKIRSSQKKKKPVTTSNILETDDHQTQTHTTTTTTTTTTTSETHLESQTLEVEDDDVIMDVTMEDCSSPANHNPVNSQPLPNDNNNNPKSAMKRTPSRSWARSSDVHTDDFLSAMMSQGIKFSVGKSGKVTTTITPPRRQSEKSFTKNALDALDDKTTSTTKDSLTKGEAGVAADMEQTFTTQGLYNSNENGFNTGDTKLNAHSRANGSRQSSTSTSSLGAKSGSFTRLSTRSYGPPAPDSDNKRSTEKPTVPQNLFSSTSSNSLPNYENDSNTETEAISLEDMARQLSEAKDSAKRDQIMALRDVGRSLYINAQYKESISKYTTAIEVFNGHFLSPNNDVKNGELLATLYGNRAAGLMMIGAYDASSSDCTNALENLSEFKHALSSQEIINSAMSNLRPDGGITLVTKLLARKGRSCLKAGKCNSAEDAFDQSIRLGRLGLLAHQRSREAKLQSGDDSSPSESEQLAEKSLNQTVTESTINKSEVFRLKECIKAIKSLGGVNSNPDSATLKRNNLQLLHHLNSASALASGDISLQEERIKCLASMKRWTEVAAYCERLACDNVKSDGVYTGDLVHLDPFPGIERAAYLKWNTFESDPRESSSRILNSKEVAEAVLRLPISILKIYMRALRLEERYSEASKASKALGDYITSQKVIGASFDWLKVECDKFRRTINGKDRGDELYKNSEYKLAAMKYASILTIDAEGDESSPKNLNKDPWDLITAGGRLHAVLHCNRAACLMALKMFREASKECTAALRIQSQYMKAILRRARCYARMEHFEESIAEYQRWSQLVDDAKKKDKTSNHFNSCPFDLAGDVSDAEYKKVMDELIDVRTSHRKAQVAAEARSNRQKWYQDNFRRSNSDFQTTGSESTFSNKNSRAQSPFTKQRHHSFQQEQSRRWDSFNGSGPKRPGNPGSTQSSTNTYQERSSFKYSNSSESTSNGRRSSTDNVSKSTKPPSHYKVLNIPKTATALQVKKAYHKLALKYHPDKNKDESSTEIFRQVKQAYEVLSDESARRKYNSELRMEEGMSYYS